MSVAALLALHAGGVLANTVFPIFVHIGPRPDYGPAPMAVFDEAVATPHQALGS